MESRNNGTSLTFRDVAILAAGCLTVAGVAKYGMEKALQHSDERAAKEHARIIQLDKERLQLYYERQATERSESRKEDEIAKGEKKNQETPSYRKDKEQHPLSPRIIPRVLPRLIPSPLTGKRW